MDCIGSGEVNSDAAQRSQPVRAAGRTRAASGFGHRTGRRNGELASRLALEEALGNALYHGNLGFPPAEIEQANSAFHQGGPDVLPDRLAPDVFASGRFTCGCNSARAGDALPFATKAQDSTRPAFRSRRIRSISVAKARPAEAWC